MSFKPTLSPKLDYYLKSSEIDHALLLHLDYASAGHTGFASSADLTGYLKLDQSIPQTIINGVPLMTTAVDEYGSGNQLTNKDYCDTGWLRPPCDDWWDPTGGLPPTPSVGDRYVADGSGSGWTEDYIYEWDGDSWIEEGPEEGWMFWMLAEYIYYVFIGSGGWVEEGYDSYWDIEEDQTGLTGDKTGTFNLTTTGILDVGTFITPYAQVLTVAKSGADYTTIQAAINAAVADGAASNKRFCIKVQSGDYAENVTMADYVDILGSGRTNSRITGTSGTVLTFPATKGTVLDMGIYVNYGALGANSAAIKSAGADSVMIRCDVGVTKSSGDFVMKALEVTGGAFRMNGCYITYSITGATVGAALSQIAVSQTGALTIFLLHDNEIIMTSDTVTDELVGFATLTGSAGSFLLENNIISLSATGAGAAATGLWLYGTATGATVARNRITIYGKAVAYGFFIESVAGGATVISNHNELIITSLGNAYSASVDSGDIWSSSFDKITAADNYTGAGTVNLVSSIAAGTFITTGTITGVNVTSGVDPGHTHTIYQPIDADLSAIAALGFASTSFLKKTAADTWALDTNVYLTAVTAHNLLSAIHGDTVAASPVLGDILYGDATPNWTKLTGNITTTKKFLTQTGLGAVSAIPAWNTIAIGDLPIITVAKGGTNLTTIVAGSILAANALDTLSAITSIVGTTYLKNVAGVVSWGAVSGGQTLYEAIVAAAGGDYTTLGAAITAGKHWIFIRNGTYTETGTITLGVGEEYHIIGETRDGTIISFANQNRQLFGNLPYGIIENITFTNSIASTMVDVNGWDERRFLVFRNCVFFPNNSAKIALDAGNWTIIDKCIIRGVGGDVSIMKVTNTSVWVTNCFFEDGNAGDTRSFLEITNTGTNFIYGNTFWGNGTANGRDIYLTTAAPCSNLYIIGNFFSSVTSTNTAISIVATVTSLKNSRIDQNDFAGNRATGKGINLAVPCENVSVSFNTITYCQYGIYLSGTNDVVMVGNTIDGTLATTPTGIYLAGTCDDNVITDNRIRDCTTGINIAANTNNRTIVANNNLQNNTTALADSAVDTIVYNNMGLDVTQEKKMILMKNTSGGALAAGDVVVLKAVVAGNEITTTVTAGDNKVFGMAVEAIADTAWGYIQVLGKTVVLKVNGTTDIAIGDYLSCFTTAKIAQKAAAGHMVFAIALEAYATDDSNGIIDALLVTPRLI